MKKIILTLFCYFAIFLFDKTEAYGQENPPSFDIKSIAQKLQETYLEGGAIEYRLLFFEFHKEMRFQKKDDVAKNAIELLDYISSKKIICDGLEPLIFTYIDAISANGNKDHKQKLSEKIKAFSKGFRYKSAPLINISMPMARFNTPVVVDVRADGLRVYLNNVSKYTKKKNIPTLNNTLINNNFINDLCKMPLLTNSNGIVLPSELDRKSKCEKFSGGASGNLPNFGDLMSGSCLNGNSNEILNIGNALNDCLQRLTTNIEEKPKVDLPFNAAAPFLGLGAAILWWGKNEIDNINRQMDKYEAASNQAKEILRQGINEIKEMESKLTKLEGQLQLLEKQYRDRQKQLASEGITSESDMAKDAELRELGKKIETKENEIADQERQISDKTDQVQDDYKEAIKKAEQLNQFNNVAAGPDQPMFNKDQKKALKECTCLLAGSPNCDLLFPDEKINKILAGEITFPLDKYINPNPEDPNYKGSSSLSDLPKCGFDRNTINAVRCQSLVMCSEYNYKRDSCKCGTAPKDAEKLIQMQLLSCASTITCPEGTEPSVNGMICNCKEKGTREAPFKPKPLPFGGYGGISKNLINIYFENPTQIITNSGAEKYFKLSFSNNVPSIPK